jgi:hypothetical protein
MFDLNAIINQALATAVAQAVEPLVKRIGELETKLVEAQLFQRTTYIDVNAATDALNQQEWFWEKIRSYIDAGIEAGLEDHTGTYDHDDFVLRGDLSELIKDTVGDFDDFIRKDDMPDPDDLVTKDELPDFDDLPHPDDIVKTGDIEAFIEDYMSRVRLTRI